ncbi:threonylcarbamoyl-AMP synthase [Candidatus Woesearchaeota archaeon]|nr:threonylcarbamoyl-AMP synthase [Candidatus Woesearchaeota archaeon]
MDTKIIKINPKNPEISKIEIASKILKKGGLVAFPTETVYGLGANGLNKIAVKKSFVAKGRPQDNPLILHVSDINQVNSLVKDIPDKAKTLMDKFWPGPLTIIFKKSKLVPDIVTCGLDSVAIRMPKNKIALELINSSGCPISAPSANLSGKPSPTNAAHVIDDLKNKIDVIIDGGQVEIGIESTVLDLTQKIPSISRPGKITKENLEKVIGDIKENVKSKKPRSPGMKYKHYSPNAEVIIINEEEDLKKILDDHLGKKIKILDYSNEIDMASRLFKDFRDCDNKKYDVILVRSVKEKNFGCAIMNRLRKASCIKNKESI